MSVIVAAAPITLMTGLGPIIAGAIGAAIGIAIRSGSGSETEIQNVYQNTTYSDHYDISKENFKKFLEKDLETNIMSKEVLIKTLTEHGAEITDTHLDNIECTIDNFVLKFTKSIPDKPYTLHVEYGSEETLNTFICELDEEYKANAQEVSYNKIMENLEAKNYTVEQEEILEDNTIVLTVNLE